MQVATASQFFISYTIRTFGALIFATIMTTRQVKLLDALRVFSQKVAIDRTNIFLKHVFRFNCSLSASYSHACGLLIP